MTVFGLILMRYFLHYGPISVKKCCVIFCIMRYAIFSLRYTFFKVIMQRTNTDILKYLHDHAQGRTFENILGVEKLLITFSLIFLVFSEVFRISHKIFKVFKTFDESFICGNSKKLVQIVFKVRDLKVKH